MVMEIANGTEPNGTAYRVYLDAPAHQWVAEIKARDGRQRAERWDWAWEPRCGPDVADVNRAEEVLERLIKELES